MFHNKMFGPFVLQNINFDRRQPSPGQLAFQGLRTERTPDNAFTRQTKPRPHPSLQKDIPEGSAVSPARGLAQRCASLPEGSETKPTLPKSASSLAGGQPPSSHMGSPAQVLKCSADTRSKGRAQACGPAPPMERDVHTFSVGGFQMPPEIDPGVAEAALQAGRNLLQE